MATVECDNCGNTATAEAAFCGRCGAPLPERPRSRLFLLGGTLMLAVLLTAGAYVLRGELSNWLSIGSHSPDTSIPSATGREPTVEMPVGVASEPGGTASATALPGPSPTRKPTFASTVVPSKTPSPTTPPTLTPTPTLTPSPTVTPTLSPGPETLVIGHSINDQPIEAVRFGTGSSAIIFVGGLHAGYAPASVGVAQQTVQHFREQPQVIPESVTVYIILNMNPDSETSPGNLPGRLNARGVDLNRNWDCEWSRDPQIGGRTVRGAGGTSPLSEPETQAVADFIIEQDPVAVIFWEARAWRGLVSPGGCGPPSPASYDLTVSYARAAGYRWEDFENLTGHVVPGDATNWLDLQGIPAAAVLLPSFTEVAWESNRMGIEAVLQAYGGQ